MPTPEGQSSDLDPTDPVKQTLGQVLPLKRPRQAYEGKFAQHLASHKPKGLASAKRLMLSTFALKFSIAL